MSSSTPCRRHHNRLDVAGDDRFCIDFTFPGPGGVDCRMQLNDLSVGGMSFELTRDLPGLEFGTQVENVRVHMGPRMVRGDFVVVHLTPSNGDLATCGVLFYPATDGDLLTLKDVLAGLQ